MPTGQRPNVCWIVVSLWIGISLLLGGCGSPSTPVVNLPPANTPLAAATAASTASTVVATGLPAAATTGATAETNQARVVTLLTHSAAGDIEYEPLKATMEKFNSRQSNYRVEIQTSSVDNYTDRVNNAAATGNLPCVLDFDGPLLYNFAWQGYLQPIDRFVSKELLADFLPSVITQGTYNGRLYSLGQVESGLGLWANRRYLQAAGVRIPTFAQPWTLAEFEEALQKLTDLPEVDYALDLKVNYGVNEFAPYAYSPILQGFGGDLIDRTTYQSAKGVLDGPQSVAAMQRFQSWFKKGWTKAERGRDDDFYASKKAALSWVGHWTYPPYKKGLGDDLMLLALPDFGHGVKTAMGSWNWGITSTCTEPDGAAAFLNMLLSPEEIAQITNVNGSIPARKSVFAQSSLYRPDGPLHVYVEQLESGAGVPRPITPAYATISKAFAEAVDKIVDGADVQAELTKAAEAIDADIAAHNGYQVKQ